MNHKSTIIFVTTIIEITGIITLIGTSMDGTLPKAISKLLPNTKPEERMLTDALYTLFIRALTRKLSLIHI